MYQKNARRRRAAPPSAAALTALAQPPSRVCTPHACLSRHRSSLRLCVSRGVPFALPVLVVFGGFVRRRRRRRRRRRARARASARAPERLAFSRGEPRCRVAARGTAPAHLEPRAYAPGVERVRACHDAHVLSSLHLVATHEARRGFAFVAEERRPIAVAGYTSWKRRDRGVGRWAGWLITSRVVYARERRRRRGGAHRGVVAGCSRLARREHRLASRWTASREAVSRRGDSPERRSRRSRASTRRRRRPRWPSVTNPGSNVSARVPQQQQCTRNTTGRSMNRNTVTVLAAPLAEEAEDEDEDTRGLS